MILFQAYEVISRSF